MRKNFSRLYLFYGRCFVGVHS